MPGNPDATPTPSDQPSWLADVQLLVTQALESSAWNDKQLMAVDVTNVLWEAGRLQEPEGFREPTDEQLEVEAAEALQEWGDTSS